MKKTNIILSLFSVVAFFTVLVVTKDLRHNSVRYTDLSVFEKSDEGEIIEAAFDWMNERRVNAETGEFSFYDVYNARNIADQLQRQNFNAKVSASLGLQWDEMGPDNVGGRTRSIIFDRNDFKKMYATSVGGGVWISTNSGASWSAATQDTMKTFESLAATAVVQAANGDIYIGTGESQPGSSSGAGGPFTGVPGEGIFKSTDGGLNFTQLAATKPLNSNSTSDLFAFVNDMAADPFDANKIWAGFEVAGLRLTTDGGETWNTVPSVPLGGVDDIKISSGNEVIVIARGGTYYKSSDGGLSFNDQTSSGGFPTGAYRLEFAIAPSDPDYIYVYAINNAGALQGIYQSKDRGDTWNEIGPGGSTSFNPPGNQGLYDAVIAVAPNDRERIWVGGQLAIFAWTPTSGWEQKSSGGSFEVHADHHEIIFHPTNPDIMFIGTDGGFYSSENATDDNPIFTARNIAFNVTQYYAMAASIQGNVLAGSQDNGSHYIPFTNNSAQGGTRVNGGDGGYCAISKSNSNVLFTEFVTLITGSAVGGVLQRSSNFGASFASIFDDNIDCTPNADGVCTAKDGVVDEGAPFITSFTLWEGIMDTVNDTIVNGVLPPNPDVVMDNEIRDTIVRTNINPAMLALGSNSGVWVCPDALVLSGNPAWYKIVSAGVSVTALAFTSDGNTLFAGTSNGKMYRVTGFRTATFGYWTNCDIKPISGSTNVWISCEYNNDSTGLTVEQLTVPWGGSYITGFGVDPNDDNHVLITLGGYSNTRIYKTTDAMAGTPTIGDVHPAASLPPMPIYDAVIDYSNANNYIIGTEMGVWTSDDAGLTWTEENRNGLARLPVLDLVQEPIIDDSVDLSQSCYFIYAATHGRGIFRTKSLANGSTCKNITPESVGIEIAKKPLLKDLKVYPNPMSNYGTIAFDVEKQGDVYLKIFDMNGKLVKNDRLGNRSVGYQEISINTSKLGMGTYFVHVQTAGNNYAGKLLVIK